MNLDVFELFPEAIKPYRWLNVKRGGVYGNVILSSQEAIGVFKLRNEMIMVNNQELKQSAARLHIRPDETFASNDMVGQGIQVEGQDYEIIGQTGGDDYHEGDREHYSLYLQNSDYSEFTEAS